MKEIWIAPTNPKYFDVIHHVQKNKELAIKCNQKRVNVGDIVYIYIASPVSQIKYKGTVISSRCNEEDFKRHKYVFDMNDGERINCFLVEINTEFPDGTYPYTVLKEKGIGQVQVLARATKEIKRFFIDQESE